MEFATQAVFCIPAGYAGASAFTGLGAKYLHINGYAPPPWFDYADY